MICQVKRREKGLKGWKRKYEGDVLGDCQWKWFETELKASSREYVRTQH